MAYTGRLAIIAGGLGGIGKATGRLLLNNGARLALLHAPLETEKAPSVLESSFENTHRDRITTFACDITDPDHVDEVFKEIEKSTNRSLIPNMLINSAGYVSLSKMEETTPQETRNNININLLGSMFTGQAFARMYMHLREQRPVGVALPGGRIINLSSQAGHVALPLHGAYCASKAGLMGLTRSMATEWGPVGITANTVSPTVVWTELGKKAWADDTIREAFQAKIPTNRFAEPEEVAGSIEFLCRDDAGMINGADIRVDGGFTIT